MDIARETALETIEQVLIKRLPMDDVFSRLAEPLSALDRAFARQLAATVLRRLGQLDDLIDPCLKKPLPPALPGIRNAMRLGVAQLLFMNVPAHAAIDTTVTLLDSHPDRRVEGFKGLVNAVLRRISRDGVGMRRHQDSARLNTPKWLWDSWTQSYSAKSARQIAEMHLREPPLDLTLRAGEDAAEWAKKLGGKVLPTGSIRLQDSGKIDALSGYQDGHWWVQDVAAAIPVRLLGDITGLSVFDLCAAPGGKTLQLASAGANVTAVDRSNARLRRLHENLRRLKLEAKVVQADGTAFRFDAPADVVLLDAPCSTTGTIRRHPDVPLLKTPRDVRTLSDVQTALLDSAAEMVKPGGTLIYCVCSLEPAEGTSQIKKFLTSHREFERRPVRADEVGGLSEIVTSKGDVRTLPFHLAEQGGMDGFYVARMQKRA